MHLVSILVLGDEFAAKFLIEQGCSTTLLLPDTRQTALHLVASYSGDTTTKTLLDGMTSVAELLIANGANVAAVDSTNKCAFHLNS